MRNMEFFRLVCLVSLVARLPGAGCDVEMEADPDWWKHVIIYQIYPRSFQDSNDDGIGDLQGNSRFLLWNILCLLISNLNKIFDATGAGR